MRADDRARLQQRHRRRAPCPAARRERARCGRAPGHRLPREPAATAAAGPRGAGARSRPPRPQAARAPRARAAPRDAAAARERLSPHRARPGRALPGDADARGGVAGGRAGECIGTVASLRLRAGGARMTSRDAAAQVKELESLRAELERTVNSAAVPRWNADPEEVQRSVAKLVLTLVEFLRQLLERQAIRRMEADSLTPEEVEAIGTALMRLEETVRDLGARFGLKPGDLNLDLGPLGRLL